MRNKLKYLSWVFALFLVADAAAGIHLSYFEPRCYVLNKDPLTFPNHALIPSCRMQIRMGFRIFDLISNSLGMRDGETREVPLSSSKQRFLLLGDSFTEGIALPWEETFAGILSLRLSPKAEILNAGTAGSLPSVYGRKVQKLLQEGVKFDEALVFLDTSDVFEAAGLPGDQFEYGTKTSGGKMAVVYVQVRAWVCHFFRYSCLAFMPFQNIQAMQEPVYKGGLLLSAWISDEGLYREWGEKGLSICAADMEKLSQILSDAKIPFTVLVYPYPQQIYERDYDSRYIRFWREWAAAHEGVKFVDLTPALTDLGPEESIRTYYLPIDFHFSAKGHERVARELEATVFQNGF